ncbi:unnamed protein product, partial [Mesorhabditis belari]|uniref:Uncharacterized protein n=1 Tax=Mesorhabditis belari TaxID=2138241 RepID=A0AAF3EKV6_9BILA
KCLEKGYVKFDAPSFRFLGGWATNRANKEAGITIVSHMDLQEAQQNRRERGIAYGQCYERSSWKATMNMTSLVYKFTQDLSLLVQKMPAFTLTGHMGDVWMSEVSDDGKYIVSGSARTVRVWCRQTGVQRHVLQGHTRTVRCMGLHGTSLVSGSRDQTLRVWDIVDGKCLHILTGHLAEVRCVQFDGKRVVSGACDFTVKVWNVQTGECLHTLTGHTKPVESLLFEPERDLVVSGSKDKTRRVWDVRRGTCIATLVTHKSSCFDMQLRRNILVSCYTSSDVGVWDIRDGGSCIHRLQGVNGHTSSIVISLQLYDSGLLVTSSNDGSVKLWDVNKGTFVRDLVRVQAASCIWDCQATGTLLVCAVEPRNGTEDGKLILIDFDASYP